MKTESGPAGRSTVLLISIGAVILASAIWLLYVCDPSSSWYVPVCRFHNLTGFYCAGCGSLRACHELVHLHPVAAFRYNPMLFIGGAFGLFLFWRSLFGTKISIGRPLAWFAVLLIIFWVLRNVPFYPFTILAPQ